MKRIALLLFVLIFFGFQFETLSIEVLPTMQSKSNVQDKVWVGSFQLAWNELMHRFVFEDVKFSQGTPNSVKELNQQNFTANDLSEKNYYKIVTKVSSRTKRQIKKCLKQRFEMNSDMVNNVDLTPRNDRVMLYAFINKQNFLFLNQFDVLGKDKFGVNQFANYYGINPKSKANVRKAAKIVFYNNPYDFAVELPTINNEVIYLYKTGINKDFETLYNELIKKSENYYGDINFNEVDELSIPYLKISEEKIFEECSEKRIKGKNLIIDKAMETLRFNINNTGEKTKAEESMPYSAALQVLPEPRLLYFNDTFVVFIKEAGKKHPYFALRVNDISKYQD